MQCVIIIINETMDNLRRPITTFCIGGGGSHLTRGSVAFNHIKNTLSEYNITPHNIHGVTDDAIGPRVRSPSEQYEEIMDNLPDRAKEKGEEGSVLLIAQCMGTIAAHQALSSMTEKKHKYSTCNLFTSITKPRQSSSIAKF